MRGRIASKVVVHTHAVDATRDEQVVEQEHVSRRRIGRVHRRHIASGHARHDPCGSESELGVQAVQHAVTHQTLGERGAWELTRRLQLLVPVAAAIERVSRHGARQEEGRLRAHGIRLVPGLTREPRRSRERVHHGQGGEVVARRYRIVEETRKVLEELGGGGGQEIKEGRRTQRLVGMRLRLEALRRRSIHIEPVHTRCDVQRFALERIGHEVQNVAPQGMRFRWRVPCAQRQTVQASGEGTHAPRQRREELRRAVGGPSAPRWLGRRGGVCLVGPFGGMAHGVVHRGAGVEAHARRIRVRSSEQVAQALDVQAHLGVIVRLVRNLQDALLRGIVTEHVLQLVPFVHELTWPRMRVRATEAEGAEPVSLGTVVQRRAQIIQRFVLRHGHSQGRRCLWQAECFDIFWQKRPLRKQQLELKGRRSGNRLLLRFRGHGTRWKNAKRLGCAGRTAAEQLGPR